MIYHNHICSLLSPLNYTKYSFSIIEGRRYYFTHPDEIDGKKVTGFSDTFYVPPESVKLDFCQMLEIRIESNVSGISTVNFSAMIRDY